MADDPYAGLTPQERQMWGLDGAGKGGTTTTTPAPAAPAGGGAVAPDTTGSASSAEAPATGVLPALAGGLVHGAEDVWNTLPRIGVPVGRADWTPYATAQAQHPWAAGIGHTAGQIGTTLPLMLGAEYMLPEVGATALAARVATNPLLRGIIAGGIGGVEQNLLTAGEDPNESLAKRIGLGLLTGGTLGGVASKIGEAFGSQVALASPAVQQAAQTAKNAGIDVSLQNLPQAGAAAAAQGAAATVPQAQQLTTAFGKILGQTLPDLSPNTLTGAVNTLGQNVGNAAAAGQVNYGLIQPALATIENQATQAGHVNPTVKGILDDILHKAAAGNGTISGADMQNLIRYGSDLDRATRSAVGDVSDAANVIESTLKDGFMQSSPTGVGTAYADARGKYKLLMALENNVKTSGVNNQTLLNPATIYDTLKGSKWLPDITRLGAGTDTMDQAANLARASDTLFGGQGAAGGQAGGSGWAQLLTPAGAAGAGTIASWLLHNPVPGLLAAPYAAYRFIGQPLGRAYQASQPFVNRLIQSGTGLGPRANALTSPAGWGRVGTAVLPGTINAVPGISP